MSHSSLLSQLKFFVEPHPAFVETEESIFTPREGLSINFMFEGGYQIECESNYTEINFNAIEDSVLVFSRYNSAQNNILRISVDRLIGYELLK